MDIKGYVKLSNWRKGKCVYEYEGSNLVVTTGKELIRSIVGTAAPGTKPTHFAVGDDGTAVTIADADLASEIAGISREAFDNTTEVGAFITYDVADGLDNDSGGQETVKEIGIFNAAGTGAGDMLARFLCQEFLFENLDLLKIYWTLQFGD